MMKAKSLHPWRQPVSRILYWTYNLYHLTATKYVSMEIVWNCGLKDLRFGSGTEHVLFVWIADKADSDKTKCVAWNWVIMYTFRGFLILIEVNIKWQATANISISIPYISLHSIQRI